MIIMSVDLGKARTGIAVSDMSETFAFPKEVIFEKNEKNLIDKICDCAKKYQADKIVVGLPKNMDGSCGERAQECERIGELIKNQSGIDVVMRDERCTTLSAHIMLNDNNIRGEKRKKSVDAVAATVILQDYLDFRKNINR
ncbi:MAG: Holliday junction resolvase RuvX [Acutalibacteraceae bacterium]|nr:Holliday junction resolvase RuvX [Acutalibacteraceae bacterium]